MAELKNHLFFPPEEYSMGAVSLYEAWWPADANRPMSLVYPTRNAATTGPTP